ncbi:uncharacterized protein IL334_007461 [Kwoniella shivajii]|uniref:HSF-type DNA-binding domain-containing protein n=1 Tax=Kwoniella shivajii TaxID=564305 RepID=A0ABZ1D8Q6_9TREE|nr:hypothetical protein IL334_007461 [Kwoniella shivajii]
MDSPLPSTIDPRLLNPRSLDLTNHPNERLEQAILPPFSLHSIAVSGLGYHDHTATFPAHVYPSNPPLDDITVSRLVDSPFHPLRREGTTWLTEDWKLLPLLPQPPRITYHSTFPPHPFTSQRTYTEQRTSINHHTTFNIADCDKEPGSNSISSLGQFATLPPPPPFPSPLPLDSQQVPHLLRGSTIRRSQTFPLNKMDAAVEEDDQLRYVVSSERDQSFGVASEGYDCKQTEEDMGCRFQQYPLGPPINIVGPACHDRGPMMWNLAEGNRLLVDDVLPSPSSNTEDDLISHDSPEDEDEEQEEEPLEIELSQSASSADQPHSAPNDTKSTKTIVVSLEAMTEEDTEPEDEKKITNPIKRPLSRPKLNFYIPKSIRPNLSSDYSVDQISTGEKINVPQSPFSQALNGKYSTRSSTLDSKLHLECKSISRNKKQGSGNKNKYKNFNTSNTNARTGSGSPSGNNGGKVPTGDFLFRLLRMLAYNKYPGFVILKGRYAFIPDTEAFAKVVYWNNSKSDEWKSFQRNLNNYQKYWGFERKAIENSQLKSQRIKIPTLRHVIKQWRRYGFSENELQFRLKELEEWKQTEPKITLEDWKKTSLTKTSPSSVKMPSVNSRNKGKKHVPAVKAERTDRIKANAKVEGHKVEEEVDEPYSEKGDSSFPQINSNDTQSDSDIEVPLRKVQERRISSEENIHLKLTLGGQQLPITPVKSKASKRTFATMAESPENGKHIVLVAFKLLNQFVLVQLEIDYPNEAFTPSPTFSEPLITPHTAVFPPVKMPRNSNYHVRTHESSFRKVSPEESIPPISRGQEVEEIFGPVVDGVLEYEGKDRGMM